MRRAGAETRSMARPGCLRLLGRHDLDLATGTVTIRQNHGGGVGKEDPVDAEVKGIAADR